MTFQQPPITRAQTRDILFEALAQDWERSDCDRDRGRSWFAFSPRHSQANRQDSKGAKPWVHPLSKLVHNISNG